MWDVTAPEMPVAVFDRWIVAEAVALSPHGERVYVALEDGTVGGFDVVTGEKVVAGIPQYATGWGVDTLEVSPDGTRLAVKDLDEIVILDARPTSLTEETRLVGHTGQVNTVEFSADGTLLASGGDDGTVILWDVATGKRRAVLTGHTGSVRGLDFGLGDDTLYSVSSGRELIVWDLDGGRQSIPLIANAGAEEIEFAVPAPDGEAVAFLSWNSPAPSVWRSEVRFFDVEAGRLGERVATGNGHWGPTWRPPDSEQFATADVDGVVHVWDWRTGAVVAERNVAAAPITDASYTVDGSALLASDETGMVHQLDADTLEPLAPPLDVGRAVSGFALSSDGRRAVVIAGGTAYASLDLVAGRVDDVRDLGIQVGWAEMSPDGRRLAVGSEAGEVGIVDLGAASGCARRRPGMPAPCSGSRTPPTDRCSPAPATTASSACGTAERANC